MNASLARSPIGAAALLELIDAMLRDLRGASGVRASLDDDLERTLGFDSLARMELLLRVERAFGVRLPEALARDARTPRDLLRALAAALPRDHIEIAETAARPARVDALPHGAGTLVDVLRWHAQHHPEHAHVTFDDAANEPRVLTHRALLDKARAVAAGLQHAGVEPGRCVALMLPSGFDFFAVFAGIALAGAVPVPIYPPLRADQIEDHLRRQAAILDNARAQFLVADALTRPAARVLRTAVASLRAVVGVEELAGRGNALAPVRPRPNDIAFLQYTSGSTGQPKGVVVTHASLLANLRAMGNVIGAGPHDRFVSWLPLYHDMGLIGAWMGSLYYGIALWLMPPQAFLARPARWLQALHRHRGTLSAAPNFAYEVAASKIPDDELRGLDLSAWRLAFNGAEPIHAATLKRFADRFARYGFDARAMYPVYGLAECGLGLAFPPPGRGLKIDRIDRDALHRGARALPARDVGGAAMEVVSCGLPLPGHQIRIVDGAGTEARERSEGRVQFRGPSATPGYFRNDAATRELFDGDWLETGDIGYVAEGELYLTSRAKELIIRGGHNLHPYELEQAAGELPGVRRGCVAVFGASDPASATERIVVLAEVRERDEAGQAALRERIAGLALSILGVPADDIVLAESRVVLKTSSGKIRRAACRDFYERGLVHAPVRPVPVQVARLVMHGLAGRARSAARAAAPLLESAWLWTAVALFVFAGLAFVAWWPSLAARRRGIRALAKALLRGSAIPVQLEGEQRVPSGPAIYVANHASYADWLVLLSALPPDVTIVAKRELASRSLLGWIVGRVAPRFVTRDDAQRGVEDTRSLVEAARAGESLVLFPEGMLSRVPGLRAFRMGAFVVSAESGLPVVPVALRGTRSVLRDGTRLLRRHPLAVHFSAALRPRANGWSEAVALRDAARAAIARQCGEPDLERGARLSREAQAA